jgi:hypothetical protein
MSGNLSPQDDLDDPKNNQQLALIPENSKLALPENLRTLARVKEIEQRSMQE